MLLVIKGKVDDWRLQRRAAWKVVEGFRGTKDMPDLCDFYSLPFDDEIRQLEAKAQTEDILEWYNRASSELDSVIWEKKKSK